MDRAILDADIFITQRPTDLKNLEYLHGVKSQTKAKIVIDMDDHLHALPPSNPLYKYYRTGLPANKVLEQSLSLCDVWTTASSKMAEAREYRSRVPKVEVIENAIDDTLFDAMEKRAPSSLAGRDRREGEFRIGWAGSNTHTADLLSVKDALCKFMREDDSVRFVLYGYPQPQEISRHFGDLASRVENAGVFHFPAKPGDDGIEYSCRFFAAYYEALAELEVDVMIAPLVSTTFNNCKSPLKILESAVAGYPVVASRTGPYSRYAAEGEGLILTAGDTREWLATLHAMRDPERRVAMVERNREHIRERHVSSRRAEAYAALLRSLVT